MLVCLVYFTEFSHFHPNLPIVFTLSPWSLNLLRTVRPVHWTNSQPVTCSLGFLPSIPIPEVITFQWLTVNTSLRTYCQRSILLSFPIYTNKFINIISFCWVSDKTRHKMLLSELTRILRCNLQFHDLIIARWNQKEFFLTSRLFWLHGVYWWYTFD